MLKGLYMLVLVLDGLDLNFVFRLLILGFLVDNVFLIDFSFFSYGRGIIYFLV